MSRSFGATKLTSLPSMRISPEETLSKPAIIASSVDLPQPDGPTKAMNSPVFASRSTPLSTSTGPKFLRNWEMVSDDMRAPSLDRSLGQAADEILAAEEIDQQRRDGADQHGRAHHVVDFGVGVAGGEADQGGGDRLAAARGEDDAEQIVVPDAGELPDHGDDQDRRRQRQDDLPENPPEAGAVDARRLDQVVGNVDVVVAAEQRGEGCPLHAVDQDRSEEH